MHAQQSVCVCMCFSEIAGRGKNRGRAKKSTRESCYCGLLHMISAHAIHIHGMYPLNIKRTHPIPEIHEYRHRNALVS